MSEINYQALREIAKKATQGEWVAFISPGKYGTYAVHTPGDNHHGDIVDWPGFDEQKNAENNARYIAAFNPEVVQALLDERERNQQYIKRRDQENEDIALTVGKLRVELEDTKSKLNEQREYYEGVIADGSKRIAELEKQCAEWERKALSNFEECAAMAERIEEMSKQSCEARERDLFESWVMHSICISKSTLEGLRTETGYRNATLSGTDFNRMWEQWKSIRAAGIRIKGE
ncbi:ead/Ea22-like family protein [Escherichia coli]|uniref:ead/Ea22-like family protein n=1 Tax=Escherichia coli TaxID=562 RepID=UPI00266C55D0|nr:ead/Ea22-like family protein [Escherichia coli]WKR68645.1 ead/Ea22-like family protein [Escherichia coli]